MARRIAKVVGAGPSDTWSAQQDREGRGHWFKLRRHDIEHVDCCHTTLPLLWRKAIKNPMVMQEVTWIQGSGPGSVHREYAMYDPEKKMMLANELSCPNMYGHHLYSTCWCCGQYG